MNFDTEVDPGVLARGRDYYEGRRVTDVEETDGVWTATVLGSAPYHVAVTEEAGGRLSLSCTCPYDRGPVCKHMVAVLFAIASRDEGEQADGGEEGADMHQPATTASKLRAALQDLPRETLLTLLVELGTGNLQVAHMLLARYGQPRETKAEAVAAVRGALALGQKSKGFIDYWGAAEAARAVDALLGQAGRLVEAGQAERAVPIYEAVLEEVLAAMAHADDSMGTLGGTIEWALEGLRGAARSLPPDPGASLFAYCLAQATSPPYDEWEWRWDLAQIAADLTTTPAERALLFATLDGMAGRRAAGAGPHFQERLSAVDRERADRIRLTVIARQDDDEAVVAFLEARLDRASFREALARHHLNRGERTAARALCEAWLREPDSVDPRDGRAFLEILLQIALEESNRDEIISRAETLLLETGDFSYYDRLRQTVTPEKWGAFVEALLEKAAEGQARYLVLPGLCVRERQWAQLLAYVQDSPSALGSYREYLEPRFPEEVGAIYERLVWHTLGGRPGRKAYQTACGYLQRMQLLGLGERAAALARELVETYPRRRALKEEL
ncbi:MAG: SWIM zinc finger family protein, partial [Anaerolineae bacterium]|nr:SWIM zinc finger family protein [Anaerolineae bacterium]